jgi:outer membrane protein
MFQKVLIFTILITGTSITSNFAQQKFGHLNSGNMLELMPEVKESDKKLAALDDSLGIQLDTMSVRFKRKYDAALKAVNEGTMTKIQQSTTEQQLNEEQAAITEFQKLGQVMITQRRQALLAPVIDRLNDAIVEVGKEKGYSFIFDVSGGSMLYVTEADDVTTLVASKLGLTIPK